MDVADVLVAVVRRPAGDVLSDFDEQHLGPDSRFQPRFQRSLLIVLATFQVDEIRGGITGISVDVLFIMADWAD